MEAVDGRRLAASWVEAGRRRVLTRRLRAAGFLLREIAELLNVSTETVRRDLR